MAIFHLDSFCSFALGGEGVVIKWSCAPADRSDDFDPDPLLIRLALIGSYFFYESETTTNIRIEVKEILVYRYKSVKNTQEQEIMS